MKCKEAHAKAIEYARSRASDFDPHFEACAECSRFLEAQLAMSSAFAALSREVPAPPNLEAKLIAEFDASAHAGRRRSRWWLGAAAALATSLAIAVFGIHRRPPAARIAGEPFVEIPYIAPLAPYERINIVRMNVPVSALIAAGFDMHAVDTGAALAADVLFGQDGRAHAIRLVSNSVPNSDRRIIQ